MKRLLLLLFFISTSAMAQFWQDINGVPQPQIIYQTASGRLLVGSAQSGIYYSDDDGITWAPTSFHLQNKNVSSISGFRDTLFAVVNDANEFDISFDGGLVWNTINTDNVFAIKVSDSGKVFGLGRFTEPGELNSRYRIFQYDGRRWQPVGASTPFFSNDVFVSVFGMDHSNNFFLGTLRCGFFNCTPVGVYVSTDNGISWANHSLGGFIYNVTVTPSNAVIATTSTNLFSKPSQGQVYESVNAGASWISIERSFNGYSTSLTSDSTGKLFLSTTSGLYHYRDSLLKWEFIDTPADTLITDALATRSGSLIVASPELGIFRSTDNGTTWSSDGPQLKDVFSLAITDSGHIFVGTLGDRVYVLKKIGGNWQHVPVDSMCDYVFSLAKTSSSVFAGTDCGVYRTTDDGAHWSLMSEGAINGTVYTVATNSAGDIFAGTNFGVYRSTDNGTSWTQSGISSYGILFLTIGSGNRIFAATENDGVYFSSDNGSTWQVRGLKTSAADTINIETIAANSSGTLFAGVYGGIYKSTDNGASWAKTIFTNSNVYALAFGNGQDVYAGTFSGVFVSHDDGAFWSRMNTDGLSQRFVLSLAFDPTNNLIAGTYHGGVYRTSQTLTSVESTPEWPTSFSLLQNYPNPFNPTTVIRYQLPVASSVRIDVYNILGEKVSTIIDEIQTAGNHLLEFKASNLSSGIYFYRLTTPTQTFVQKMLLVR